MKNRIISTLLTVVMIVMLLTAMCPGVLAAPIELTVGTAYATTSADKVTKETDIAVVPGSESVTKNGITVTATVSEDKKSMNIAYSGTPLGEGIVEFEIKYSTGGAEQTHKVVFNVSQQKTAALTPEVTSAEPSNLQLTYKKSDMAVKFTVTATGNGTVSYRWKVDGVEVGVGNTFTLVPEDMTIDKHTVECVVSNTIDDTTKHSTVTWDVTIEKSAAPEITSTVTTAEIDGTGSADFEVTAEGENLKYQWYLVSGSKKEKVVDGTYGAVSYAGAATNKLTVTCTMAPQKASTKFICEVANADGLTATTEEYVLNIAEDPEANKVQKIEVTTKPNKTEYTVGETLDEDGMKITVTTGKGTEEVTSGFVCTPLYLEEEGSQTITVSYKGKTTTFTVTVNEAPHEHEWSDWKVENSTPERVYRECTAGDECTAKEVLSKESFIVQYPTFAAELGLSMDDDTADSTDADSGTEDAVTDSGSDDATTDNTGVDTEEKNGGNAILWIIIVIAILLLVAVIFYYFKIYRKPYKKPVNRTNVNRKR